MRLLRSFDQKQKSCVIIAELIPCTFLRKSRFALPYFAVIDQILKANLSVADSAMVLTGYNLGYALPFLIVPGLALVLGEASRQVLARINEKVDRVSTWLMPLMLALVGIFLVADAILYFVLGKGLF